MKPAERVPACYAGGGDKTHVLRIKRCAYSLICFSRFFRWKLRTAL
jgi:hypothetical protein